ncbi:efflux RND transporter periplasmic adaptor subunit [uncultured Paludibaculum sp.]|uniref:efflux RND transporter periplasmic adaptor subunit n=1 Tax=uncultured Paludibaculum sp. TaxID=1765020 RepID=UPI002AAB8F9A|nr:efflux RND transporter periplasmic adaptor subunit [uncultured Paludibaculum sp.]
MKPGLVCFITVTSFLAGCSHSKPEPPPTEEKKESGLVHISAEAQRHFGLQVEPARVQELDEYLQVPGTVQPIDSHVNTVRPLARGRLHDVLVRIGDRVRKGQPLATYDNIEAGELAAQLAGARAELERLRGQERNLARQTTRARALADIGAVPTKEFEQATTEQQGAQQYIKSQESTIAGMLARLRRFGVPDGDLAKAPVATISAPMAGVVTKQEASPGEVIESSTALFTIADLSSVWVQAEVYEKDLGRVRVGQSAFVTVDTYANQPFTGKVTYVSDFLDPRTRTARVRCEVPNADIRLKLEMFATVNLPTTFSRKTLAVPAGAVQEVGDKAVVFVRRTATEFEPRSVSVGNTVRDLVEITSGLRQGESVVKAGAFHLKSILVGKELGEE